MTYEGDGPVFRRVHGQQHTKVPPIGRGDHRELQRSLKTVANVLHSLDIHDPVQFPDSGGKRSERQRPIAPAPHPLADGGVPTPHVVGAQSLGVGSDGCRIGQNHRRADRKPSHGASSRHRLRVRHTWEA
jgi:hypothetical protein